MENFNSMAGSVLTGKKILFAGNEPDISWKVMGEKILGACSDCTLDQATTHSAATEMMEAQKYDVVILDIMGVRGFDLLELAASRNIKVAMFTEHDLNPKTLELSFKKGARTYIPQERLGEIVPYLESILTTHHLPGWGYLLSKVADFFDGIFESAQKQQTMGASMNSPEASR
ncbi:MAG: response regulator [Syntrophales bacterium]